MANHWLASARAGAGIEAEPLAAQIPAAGALPLAGPAGFSAWADLRTTLRRRFYAWFMPLLAFVDAVAVVGVFALTYALRFRWHLLAPAASPPWRPYALAMPLVSGLWVAALAGVGLYRSRRVPSRFDDLVLLASGLLVGGVGTVAMGFFYRQFSYSRLLLAYGFVGTFIALGALHLFLRVWQGRVLARGGLALNTLVVGCNGLGAAIASRLVRSPQLGFRVVGFLPAPGEDHVSEEWTSDLPRYTEASERPLPAGSMRVLGSSRQLAEVLDSHAVDEVILAKPGAAFGELFEMIGQAHGKSVQFRIVPDLFELVTANLQISQLDGVPTLEIRDIPLRKWQNRFLKRSLDTVLSLFGLTVLSPLLAVVALLVKASSPGPVFYWQERLGRDGRTFHVCKFRTMRIDAEEQSGPVWAKAGDPRCTPLGAMLRRFSLDELPQLWNVLRGDMSLVGPRPERPFFVDRFRQYIPKYMDRHLVRSGLTGWAQINGLRGEEGSIEERTRYDIYYVENWSLLFDLKIIAATVLAIFGHGIRGQAS